MFSRPDYLSWIDVEFNLIRYEEVAMDLDRSHFDAQQVRVLPIREDGYQFGQFLNNAITSVLVNVLARQFEQGAPVFRGGCLNVDVSQRAIDKPEVIGLIEGGAVHDGGGCDA